MEGKKPTFCVFYPTTDGVGLVERHLYRLVNLCAAGLDMELSPAATGLN